jgi:hypothetical protein
MLIKLYSSSRDLIRNHALFIIFSSRLICLIFLRIFSSEYLEISLRAFLVLNQNSSKNNSNSLFSTWLEAGCVLFFLILLLSIIFLVLFMSAFLLSSHILSNFLLVKFLTFKSKGFSLSILSKILLSKLAIIQLSLSEIFSLSFLLKGFLNSAIL